MAVSRGTKKTQALRHCAADRSLKFNGQSAGPLREIAMNPGEDTNGHDVVELAYQKSLMHEILHAIGEWLCDRIFLSVYSLPHSSRDEEIRDFKSPQAISLMAFPAGNPEKPRRAR
jgi:hypothetical protein